MLRSQVAATILYKLFIRKDSFLKKADYFYSMSIVPGVGNCLFLHAPGAGNRTSIEENIANPRGVPGGGGGNSKN